MIMDDCQSLSIVGLCFHSLWFFHGEINFFPHLNNVYDREKCEYMKGKCIHMAHNPTSRHLYI